MLQRLITRHAIPLLLTLCACLHPLDAHAATAITKSNPAAQTEPLTEGLVNAFAHQDFKRAGQLVNAIRKRFHNMRRKMKSRPFNERKERELAMMHAWLRVITVAIRNRSGIGGAIAANQLTAAMIRNERFPDTVKSSIAWLDYLSRDIVLLNMEGPKSNASLLAIRRDDITITWNHLRNLLLKNFRNKTITMNIDHLVKHLDTHLDRASQIADGKQLGAWVEKLEHLPDPEKKG